MASIPGLPDFILPFLILEGPYLNAIFEIHLNVEKRNAGMGIENLEVFTCIFNFLAFIIPPKIVEFLKVPYLVIQ
ncbi:hypothetical protein A994_00155 [Methanobacterium formicicum DSM 3637]|uniref:Uncharacterized protein n=1 Tax=Methanobacterium formicicum (strain DSM 3637 / PP1) TaxID=1204725 RepID=K2QEX7_METFP|nr:hypothetical protein A994_00155 [Methanobacterium formicicum DSM 3637]